MSTKNNGFSEDPATFAGSKSRPDVLKVRQIGNSAGLLLSKELLAKLGVEIGDEIQAIDTSRGIELTAFDADLDDAMKWIEKGAKRYRNTLRALAK
jgi:putative addiction module antidote